jgi:hypothetical protein
MSVLLFSFMAMIAHSPFSSTARSTYTCRAIPNLVFNPVLLFSNFNQSHDRPHSILIHRQVNIHLPCHTKPCPLALLISNSVQYSQLITHLQLFHRDIDISLVDWA